MRKNVFILNGYQRSGKDTVAHIVNEKYKVTLFSTIDTVKEIYCICGYEGKRLPGIQGWEENKTPEDRKIMSDLKDYLTRRFNLPFVEACDLINAHIASKGKDEYLFLMVREPSEIQKLKRKYPFIKAVFVDAKARLGNITISNHADAEVENYEYDIILDNNGTLEDFKQEVRTKIMNGKKGTPIMFKDIFKKKNAGTKPNTTAQAEPIYYRIYKKGPCSKYGAYTVLLDDKMYTESQAVSTVQYMNRTANICEHYYAVPVR